MRFGGSSEESVDMKVWGVELGVEGWRRTIGGTRDGVASRRDQVRMGRTKPGRAHAGFE
jgi:hypothetical protein